MPKKLKIVFVCFYAMEKCSSLYQMVAMTILFYFMFFVYTCRIHNDMNTFFPIPCLHTLHYIQNTVCCSCSRSMYVCSCISSNLGLVHSYNGSHLSPKHDAALATKTLCKWSPIRQSCIQGSSPSRLLQLLAMVYYIATSPQNPICHFEWFWISSTCQW